MVCVLLCPPHLRLPRALSTFSSPSRCLNDEISVSNFELIIVIDFNIIVTIESSKVNS